MRIHRQPKIIVGLDLSLTGTGVVVLETSWTPGSWQGVRTATFGYGLPEGVSERDRIGRIVDIAQRVVAFVPRGAEVFIESLAFGRFTGSASSKLAGLTDVVKVALFMDKGILTQVVTAGQARKLLLGYGQGQDIKKQVEQRLRGAGAPVRNNNEADAFAIANYGRSELGLSALSFVGRGLA